MIYSLLNSKNIIWPKSVPQKYLIDFSNNNNIDFNLLWVEMWSIPHFFKEKFCHTSFVLRFQVCIWFNTFVLSFFFFTFSCGFRCQRFLTAKQVTTSPTITSRFLPCIWMQFISFTSFNDAVSFRVFSKIENPEKTCHRQRTRCQSPLPQRFGVTFPVKMKTTKKKASFFSHFFFTYVLHGHGLGKKMKAFIATSLRWSHADDGWSHAYTIACNNHHFMPTKVLMICKITFENDTKWQHSHIASSAEEGDGKRNLGEVWFDKLFGIIMSTIMKKWHWPIKMNCLESSS